MGRTRNVDYEQLLAFRIALRRFQRWSEEQAKAADMTPAQHQLLLCVRGCSDPDGPTISDIADCLMLRHHSAVELVDRAAKSGLVRRHDDLADARVTRVRLTAKGGRILQTLTSVHLEELRRLSALLQPVIAAD